VPDPGQFFFLPTGLPEQLGRLPVPLDKVVHASGYFLLLLLSAAALNSTSDGIGFAWLLAGGAVHGALTELIQLAVPPREGSWSDFIADVVGLAIGALVWRLFHRSVNARSR
jgi:VanZ family protein